MQTEIGRTSGGLLRGAFVTTWLVMTVALAIYCTVKSDPRTPAFLPFAHWFDSLADYRHFVMIIGITVPPAIFMSTRRENVRRRSILFGLAAFMLLIEIAQIWIPNRTFDQMDVFCTVLPVVILEALVMLYIESRFE